MMTVQRGRVQFVLIVGLALALVVARPTAALAQAAFPDVPTDNWTLYDTVQELAAEGILHGYPDGTFGGRRAMTRWEFAWALWRTAMKVEQKLAKIRPANTPAPPLVSSPAARLFADVPTDSSLGDLLRDL